MVVRVGISGLGITLELASILATVIDKEVVETESSFLALQTTDSWRRNGFSGHSSSRSPGSGLS